MSFIPIACSQHNHTHCVSDALSVAKRICGERGVKLTPQREQVLTLIWQNHKPLGAYDLLDMLSHISTKRVAPPTVYRALDFLLEQGFIHRINGLNAYIGCPSPEDRHQSHFLLCRLCGVAVEISSAPVTEAISLAARNAGFSVENHSLEVIGVCPTCAKSISALSLKDSDHE